MSDQSVPLVTVTSVVSLLRKHLCSISYLHVSLINKKSPWKVWKEKQINFILTFDQEYFYSILKLHNYVKIFSRNSFRKNFRIPEHVFILVDAIFRIRITALQKPRIINQKCQKYKKTKNQFYIRKTISFFFFLLS